MKLHTISAFLAATAFCCAVPSPANAQAPPQNRIAHDFLAIFGVNVHFGDNAYQNTQAIAVALHRLGISRVRSSCTSAAEVQAWKQLAAQRAAYFPAGLKADVLINSYLNAPDVTFAGQQKWIVQIAPLIESIEGPNEINNYSVGHGTHGPDGTSDQTLNFAANSLDWAKALSGWKKSVPALSQVTLLAPSIASGDPNDYAKLPNVSPYVDYGNIHFYAGNGRQPSGFGGGNFAAIYQWYEAAAAPSKSLAVTECGQTTAGKPGQGGCDEATQAKYILNQMFDAAMRGAKRAYFYQLMDDTSDGDPTGNGGSESHFGLFDYKWRAKPAALAIESVKTLLADKPGRPTPAIPTPAIPKYTVSGITQAGAAGSSLALSNRDGSTFIVVWNEPPIWDAKTNTPVTPPTDLVTVNFGKRCAYKVYDPLVGVKAIAAGQGSQVQANILGSPIMIQVVPLSR